MVSILVLEDSANMLDLLYEALELNGYTVLSGQSGEEGMALLAEAAELPDLIISDLVMPDMDGMTFISLLRQHPEWSRIPVIAVSGYLNNQRRALEKGANVFIGKPFKIERLQAAIERLLPKSRH